MKENTTKPVTLDMSDADYFADPALDQSQLKAFLANDRDWAYQRLNPGAEEPTPAMKFGTAFHAYMLGTGDVVAPTGELAGKSAATKAYKEWKAEQEAAGRIVVTAKDMQTLTRMRDNFTRDAERTAILENGYHERVIMWTDTETGIRLKAKLDLIPRDTDYIVDLKTCADASATGFAKAAYDHRYDIQAEFYRAAVAQINPSAFHRATRIPTGTQFWAFEKTRSCDWAVRTIDADNPMAALARSTIRQTLTRIRLAMDEAEANGYGEGLDAAARWCLDKGGYSKKSEEIDFPDWALRDAESRI